MSARRDLRLLAAAVLLSAAGDFLALIALVLRVHDVSGSAIAVSALFAAFMVPVVLLAPVAGLVVDRVESVRLIVAVSLAQAAVAAVLVPAHGLALILVLCVLLGIGAALSQPAEAALVPAVARDGRLTEANGWIETARYAGFAIGPLAASALAATGGTRLALVANALSFVAVAGAVAAMRTRRAPQPSAHAEGGRARDGIVLLWRDRVLRVVVLAATAGLVFMSMSMTAELFYVVDVVGAGGGGYAAVMAAWTIGMVVGATAVARRVSRGNLAAGGLAALALQGAGMAAGASWALLAVVMAGFFAGGVGHGVKNVLVRTLIGRRAPERVHGRAFAAYNAARNTAELGALGLGGVLVAAIGAQPALLIAGLGPVLIGAIGLAALPDRTGASAGDILTPALGLDHGE
jgi:Na+/melibiose symporter-like transporter